MTSNLRFRLLLLLVLPLSVLALMGAWFAYRSAEAAAGQHDQRLMRLLPALAEAVLAPSLSNQAPPLIMLPPTVEEFLRQRQNEAGYAIADLKGRVLAGDTWIRVEVPSTKAAEFHSQEFAGIMYRVAVVRVETAGAGEMVVALADGSDARQQWAKQLLMRVLLPNVLLIAAAGLAIYWSVRQAFEPLVALAGAVERRSPRDLQPIDEAASPDEVRPLVRSLNRLFALVDVQAQEQRRFVADAAHQLRTPLAALQAQVEAWALMVQSAPAPDGPRERTLVLGATQIHQLRDATRRTSQLARQLLALSRADARHAQAQPLQRVDLKDLCESLLEAFFEQAAAKDIDFGLEVVPASVWGHAWLLRELLSNLVDNALKYNPDGGRVTLRCGVRGGSAFLEVEDDGPGVPEAERERIVQRFYRLPGASGEGSGLGLAIADEIAQLHQTRLQLGEGADGAGLRVLLEFPPEPVAAP
ncbi:sensor histidine kinase [Comamonas endophytica]|uniref:histidine kinase n=1 Tax=Comamonas endophytica TaxID=2949090 RepID=A0ABY6G6H8_9BURK|nr:MULTISPECIES: sensor histidine kinase [unclassified Acidovorax]MCD2511110.1 sensor histidine kinase N-terminal domain-containing protein [Acidovorax sp. D4N7]UYG50513.1 sensor histidine kinase N-terminal domain-containing protein [Acidovorax sp. 5MLIR]